MYVCISIIFYVYIYIMIFAYLHLICVRMTHSIPTRGRWVFVPTCVNGRAMASQWRASMRSLSHRICQHLGRWGNDGNGEGMMSQQSHIKARSSMYFDDSLCMSGMFMYCTFARKWILGARGQCFLHAVMSVKWHLGWRDLFPQRKTLDSWRWRWRERNPKHRILNSKTF